MVFLLPSHAFTTLSVCTSFFSLPIFSECSYWTWPSIVLRPNLHVLPTPPVYTPTESPVGDLTHLKKGLVGFASLWGQIILIGWSHSGGSQVCKHVTQAHSFQVMLGSKFGKWVYCMPLSPRGKRDELIMIPCKFIPTMEKKTKSNFYSKDTHCCVFF